MDGKGLSFNTRKALEINLGETAANEIVTVIDDLTSQVEHLKRTKVTRTLIVKDDAGE